jgi:hypothetical protein
MTRGKILAATLAIAGGLMLGLGGGSTSASAQAYACPAGYYFAEGACYPAYAYAPQAFGFGFDNGFHDGFRHDGFHDGGFHGGGFHGGMGGFHGGGGHR